jgi:hypothetical protein
LSSILFLIVTTEIEQQAADAKAAESLAILDQVLNRVEQRK